MTVLKVRSTGAYVLEVNVGDRMIEVIWGPPRDNALKAKVYKALLAQSENAKIQIQQTKEQLAATGKRVEVGLLPELNLLELETQLANDSSSYITAISNVQQ